MIYNEPGKAFKISFEMYLHRYGINYACSSYEDFETILGAHKTNGQPIPEGAAWGDLAASILNRCCFDEPLSQPYAGIILKGADYVLFNGKYFLLPPAFKAVYTMKDGSQIIYYDYNHALIYGAVMLDPGQKPNGDEENINDIQIFNSLCFEI